MQLSLKSEQIPMGTNYIEWYHLTYLTCICEVYFYVLCPCLLCLSTLLFYGQPSKSPVDRRGYLPISLPPCFTAADFVMALNSLDDSAVPKKIHCCIFYYFLSPKRGRGSDINRLEEKQLFSAWERLGFIAVHEKLIGGLFCVGVHFTADCMCWSSRKSKWRRPVFMVSVVAVLTSCVTQE